MKRLLVLIAFFSTLFAQAQTYRTSFGTILSEVSGRPARIPLMKALYVPLVRDRVLMQAYNGTEATANVKQYFDAGFRVILNIEGSYKDLSGNPMAWENPSYAATMTDSILKHYNPEVVVEDNEEDNGLYHTGPDSNYVNILKATIPVVHSHGKKIANAGLTWEATRAWVYHYYVAHNLTQLATAFKTNYLVTHGVDVNGSAFTTLWQRADYFLTQYSSLALDYINVHLYISAADQFNPQLFKQISDLITLATGKVVISNEFGVRTADIKTAQNTFTAVNRSGMPYGIFWSGDSTSSPTFGLTNGTVLNARGNTIKNFLYQLTSQKNYRVTDLGADNSFSLDDQTMTAISNDPALSAESPNSLVTEYAVSQALKNAGGGSIIIINDSTVEFDTTIVMTGYPAHFALPHHQGAAPRDIQTSVSDAEGISYYPPHWDNTYIYLDYNVAPICNCAFTFIIKPQIAGP